MPPHIFGLAKSIYYTPYIDKPGIIQSSGHSPLPPFEDARPFDLIPLNCSHNSCHAPSSLSHFVEVFVEICLAPIQTCAGCEELVVDRAFACTSSQSSHLGSMPSTSSSFLCKCLDHFGSFVWIFVACIALQDRRAHFPRYGTCKSTAAAGC
jgi:hypothetical protein